MRFDVTVNNVLALVNTKLLRDYAALDPRYTGGGYFNGRGPPGTYGRLQASSGVGTAALRQHCREEQDTPHARQGLCAVPLELSVPCSSLPCFGSQHFSTAPTSLLSAFPLTLPRLRQLVFLVKQWAKLRGVNDSYR